MGLSPTIATPAMPRRLPWCTALLCVATAAMSAHTAIEISGSWLGRVRIVQLEDVGLRWEYLRAFELWRLITSQLVHVKQPHMVSDVVCLGLVGRAVERHVGPVRLLVLWLFGGAMATLVSTFTGPPPWNLGTGVSQAVMAISGAGLWLALAGVDRTRSLLMPVAFAIALAMMIDVIHVHHPKPHHVAGVLFGFLIASRFRIVTGNSRYPPGGPGTVLARDPMHSEDSR